MNWCKVCEKEIQSIAAHTENHRNKTGNKSLIVTKVFSEGKYIVNYRVRGDLWGDLKNMFPVFAGNVET